MKHSETIPAFFIVGVKDFTYSKELESFLKDFPVSGLALFNSPFDNPLNIWTNPDAALEAVHEFVTEASKKIGFFAADQEGGRVRRLRSPFVRLPSAQQMTESFQKTGTMVPIKEIYRLAARQMFNTGIRLNFGPVCDLKTSLSNNVVGDRSYGESIAEVLPFIEAFCNAFEAEGVRTCLKHFPGHGPTKMDSHEQIALVFKSKSEMKIEDREVFAKAAVNSSAVMTAHIAFENDPDRIFSLDADLLEDFKSGMPPNLAWITDDVLSMKAVSEKQPWIKAFECEYSYILLCGDLDQSAKAIEETIRYSEKKTASFQEELLLEKRAEKSFNQFRQTIELAKFSKWKAKILEDEKLGNEFLEKAKIKF